MDTHILWALIGQTAIIVAGVVVAIVYNNSRFNTLEANLNRRIDDLRSEMNNRFADFRLWIQSEFSAQRAEVRAGFQRLEERMEHLEHPVSRP